MPERAASTRLADWRVCIDAALCTALDAIPEAEPGLLAAMRHAVLLGGKRLRPLLVHASGHAAGCDDAAQLDPAAVAVELVHAYSLVHDDLPAMDDDSLRRGQPAVHVSFGQAHAILAGDALQALAFQVLAEAPLGAEIRAALLVELARAAGAGGMCGGQALDIAATGLSGQTTPAALEHLQRLKTGALLRASVRLGAISAAAGDEICTRLERYANALGLAFQIRDDLLDIEGESRTLGKTTGKDQAQDKATFPALLGADGARQRLRELAEAMHAALDGLTAYRRAPLDALAQLAVERDH